MAINEREIVLDLLLKLRDGSPMHLLLKETLDAYIYLNKSSRAFISRVFEGAVEKKLYLHYVIDRVSKTPVAKMKPLVRAVLELSVYQLLFMDRVPDSAVINEAVKLVKKRGLSALSGFTNGVLRNIARNKENIPLPEEKTDREKYLSVRYSMPESLVKRFLSSYPEETERVLRAFDEERSLTIRVNPEKTDRERLSRRLREEGAETEKGLLPLSLRLLGVDSLYSLMSFEDGDFFVQDISSQLAGELSGVREGDTAIDLCAAPGGKSMILAFLAGKSGEVISCDISERKLSLIEENKERLGTDNIKLLLNDASVYREEFVEKADVLLADLPCSGLGVMGKKKDIRYQVSEEKIRELAALQKKILTEAMKYVKKGGILIYSTCTMTEEENEENYRFISESEDFVPYDFSEELPPEVKESEYGERLSNEAKKGYLRILPHYFGSDGFFISKFKRKSEH